MSRTVAAGLPPLDPIALVRFLREHQYALGPAEALRIAALLETLHDQGRSPASAEELARWLAPIVCTTAHQQANLPALLADFLTIGAEFPAPPPPPSPNGRRFPFWLRWGLPLAAIFCAALLVFVALYANRNRPTIDRAPPVAVRPPPAVAAAASDPLAQAKQVVIRLFPFELPAIPLCLVPPLCWLLYLRLRKKRRPVIDRRPYDGRSLTTIRPGTTVAPLFAAPKLTEAAQGLRTHRRFRARRPDATASARATAHCGGYPTLVAGWTYRLPEYPVVVESLARRDHVASVARALVTRLSRENVPSAIYSFTHDITALRSEDDAPVTLADLSARYDGDVLVIVGDGEALLDPWLGRLRASLQTLEAWRLVVLLTPVPRRRWSWRERRLAEAGLLVLPATPVGFTILGGFLRSAGRRPAPALERQPVRPGLLARAPSNALRWHRDSPPGESEAERLLDAIALELTPNEFELVCVLALFPELRPDLTLHVTRSLSPGGNPLADDASFAAVAALPWFRYGRMPDWLRLKLAASLGAATTAAAREIFAHWLSAVSPSGAGLTITAETLGDAVNDAVSKDPTSIYRDAIFLRFCNREDLRQLDLEIPDVVARTIARGRARVEYNGLRAAISMSIALLIVVPIISGIMQLRISAFDFSSVVAWPVVAVASALALGMIAGLACALNDSTDRTTPFGLVPLAVAIFVCVVTGLTLVLVPAQALRQIPLASWLLISAAVVPCFAMATAPGWQFKTGSRPVVFITAAGSDLPGLLAAGAGLMLAAGQVRTAVAFEADLYTSSFLVVEIFGLALPLYAVGIALLLARRTGVRFATVAAYSVVASFTGAVVFFGIETAVSGVYVNGLRFSSTVGPWQIVVTALTLVHGGAALAIRAARGTSVSIVFGICGGALVLEGFAAAVLFTVPKSLYAQEAPFAIIPAVAMLTMIALARPDSLRRISVWTTVCAASIFGYSAGLAVTALVIAGQTGLPLIGAVNAMSGEGGYANPYAQAGYIRQQTSTSMLTAALMGLAITVQFSAVRGALAWLEARANGLIWAQNARRIAAAAAFPGLDAVALVGLWLTGIAPANTSFGLNFSVLYLPAVAILTLWLGSAARPVILLSGIPFLFIVSFDHVSTAGEAGLFFSALLIYQLIVDRRFAGVLFSLPTPGALPIFALLLVGGIVVSWRLTGAIAIQTDLSSLVALLALYLGITNATRTDFYLAVFGSTCLIYAAVAYLPPIRHGIQLEYEIDPVSLVLIFELGRAYLLRAGYRPAAVVLLTNRITIVASCLLFAFVATSEWSFDVHFLPSSVDVCVAEFALGYVFSRVPLARALPLGCLLMILMASIYNILGVAVDSLAITLHEPAYAKFVDLSTINENAAGGLLVLAAALMVTWLGWRYGRWSGSNNGQEFFARYLEANIERALAGEPLIVTPGR